MLTRHHFKGLNEIMNQQLLPDFEQSEQDLVNMALAMPLESKIPKSIGLLQMYERKSIEMHKNGYYLAFSGGKDSEVIKQLAKEAGIKYEAFYNLTTIDPPELVRHIKKHHPEVLWNRQKMNMTHAVYATSVGMPTRQARWCCKEYKEGGGNDRIKILGVRIAESKRRSKIWKEFVISTKYKSTTLAPICYWTDEDVWAFIRSRNLPYCELYDQGFTRLGCIGCPQASDKDRAAQFARWPKYESMWKKACFRYFDKWSVIPRRDGKDRAFLEYIHSGQEMWEWWIHQKDDDVNQCVFEEMMSNT